MKKNAAIVLTLLLIVSLTACINSDVYNDTPPLDTGSKVENQNVIEGGGGVLYFPENIGFSETEVKLYSWELNALNEPVIFNRTDNNITIYRYTRLSSFSKKLSIRVEISENNDFAELFFKLAYSMDSIEGKGMISDEYVTLDSAQIESILKAIEENDFWNMPFEGGQIGVDGSQWIVEGLRNGEYQAISRWSPTNTTAYQYSSDGSISFQYDPDDSEIGIYNLGRFFIELYEQTLEG